MKDVIGSKNAGYTIIASAEYKEDVFVLGERNTEYGTMYVTWRLYGEKDFEIGHYIADKTEAYRDLYGYMIYDNNNIIDSCWGFIGDRDEVRANMCETAPETLRYLFYDEAEQEDEQEID